MTNVVHGQLVNRRPPKADSCVIKQRIDAPPMRGGFAEGGINLGFIGDIA
eukprot:CAMPEP_0197235642 /NCGR_PEP_ID=MMETSP1429-20130617/3016_1 /TAXON_ID=49237 /ORGANISM="Chaetoceros  sp., Strain UNC1202" /LENGTH=49 /DNA_ID= /DNA_START= /DNA_END= /DNA_ORIENTATION=